MLLPKLEPVIGDHVVVSLNNVCWFCSVERRGALGRTGAVVAYTDEIALAGAASTCPLDHRVLVKYDLPWSDGRPGTVVSQAFKAEELVIL